MLSHHVGLVCRPAVVLSFIIAGVSSLLSVLCYRYEVVLHIHISNTQQLTRWIWQLPLACSADYVGSCSSALPCSSRQIPVGVMSVEQWTLITPRKKTGTLIVAARN
jgi:hypothetical protein